MKKCLLLILQGAVLVLLFACSNSDEKSSIEEKQEQLGHEAAEAIKAPIDKAISVQGIVDDHYQEKAEQTEEMQ